MKTCKLSRQAPLKQSLVVVAALLVLLLTGLTDNVRADGGTWTNDLSGNWSDPANWNPNAVPGLGAGDVVSLTNDITNNLTVTLDTAATLGTLNLGDINNGNTYTIAPGGGALTFDNSGAGAQVNQLATSKGDTVSADLNLADNLAINNASSNNLVLSGVTSGNSRKVTVNSAGTGAVAFNNNNTFSGGLEVVAGVATFNATAQNYSEGVLLSGALGTGPVTLSDGAGLGANQASAHIGNALNFNGNARIVGNYRAYFEGQINLTGGTRTLNLNRATTNSLMTFSASGNEALSMQTVAGGPQWVVTNGTLRFVTDPGVAAGNSTIVRFNSTSTNFTAAHAGLTIGDRTVLSLGTGGLFGIGTEPALALEPGGLLNLGDGSGVARNLGVYSLSGSGGTISCLSYGTAATATLTVRGDAVTTFSGQIVDGAALNSLYTGQIWTGVAALTKSGTGTLTVDGANTYSGPTTVNAGKLITTTLSTNGNYTVANGATLGVKVAAAGTSLGMTNLTFNSVATTLEIDTGSLGNPTAPVITSTGPVTINLGGSTVTVNLKGSALSVGSFVLINAASRGGGGTGSFVLGSVPLGVAANLSTNATGSVVTLNITGVSSVARWTGSAGSNWDVGNAANLNWFDLNTLLPTYYSEPKTVIFDDTAAGSSVNLIANVAPNGMTVSNNTLNYTINGTGKIGGTGTLTKQGSATLILGTANDYAGSTLISAGTLKLGVNGAIPGGAGKGDVTLAGTLDLAGHVDAVNGLNGAGTVDNTAGNGVLTVGGNNASASLTGMIRSSGGTLSLTKSGSGTLTLANAITRTINITSGSGVVTTTNTAGIYAGQRISASGLVAGNPFYASVVSVDSPTQFTINYPATTNNTVTATLSGFNYTGDTIIGGGTVLLGGNMSSVPAATNAPYTVVGGPFGAGGNLTLSNGVVLASAGGNEIQAANIHLYGNIQIGQSLTANNQRIRLSGNLDLAGATRTVTLERGFVTGTSGNCGFGFIAWNVVPANLSSVTNGTLNLVADPGMSGDTNAWVHVASQISFKNNAGLILGNKVRTCFGTGFPFGPASNDYPNLTVSAGGTLFTSDNGANSRNMTLASLSGVGGVTNDTTGAGTSVITIDGSGVGATDNANYSGVISDGPTGFVALTKTGGARQILSGANTYTGPTTISNNGILVVNGSLAAGSVVTAAEGGMLAGTGLVAGPVTVNTNGSLSPGNNGIGTLTVNNSLTLIDESLTRVEVNSDNGACDRVTGLTSVAYAGTLVVTKLGGATVTNGQSFTLFSAGSSSGNFSSISPIGPASGLAWSFNPNNGVLKAVPGGIIPPTPTDITFQVVPGNQLVLSWPDGVGWILQSQTNPLTRGISNNWSDVIPQPTPPYTNTMSGTNRAVFFRLYAP